ncbi:MAG: hypothetical protein ABIJ61_02860 [bacterium]
MTKTILTLLVVLALPALLLAEGENEIKMTPSHDKAAEEQAAAPKETIGSVAGIQWHVPGDWTIAPEKPMRVATYQIAAVEGDSSKAECAVYYFGPDQGGSVEANIKRWIGQMKEPASVERSDLESALGKVALLEVTGTYKESAGPMMAVKAEHPGWKLIGAVVPGPQGSVFFKLTGPAATVTKVRALFVEMLKSATPAN